MIDPSLSLAISIQSNKGVYALLLGSGISRAAEIPTGWEVVLDLMRKLAAIEGANCEPDPAAWYRAAYGEEPNYATLLEGVARSPAERSSLLRSYFEPTEEEQQQGKKVPTAAHRAIAGLVTAGYIRVIVTTNFDRLLEQAIDTAGVRAAVLSTADMISGARPLVHSPCTVIKVHGDYLDPRIKNTPQELSEYDPSVNYLLDQVFDEYGLIVCGWSADWDAALRRAITRCTSRRFTTYWTTFGEPSEASKQLIQFRSAQVIPISGADAFFPMLEERVSALERLSAPHPLSARVAAETVKRYLVEGRFRIRLHDLVFEESERQRAALSDEHFPVTPATLFNIDTFRERVSRYEAATATERAILVAGCYFGRAEHDALWVAGLERVACSPDNGSGLTAWLKLRAYPGLLLLYSAGLAAVAAGRYDTLAALTQRARIERHGEDLPIGAHVFAQAVMPGDIARWLPGQERNFVPVSSHLFSVLRDDFRGIVADERRYQEYFDRFEYLLGLIYVDLSIERSSTDRPATVWGPPGIFRWRNRFGTTPPIWETVKEEASRDGDAWPLFKAGLFGGSPERFALVSQAYLSFLSQLPWG